MNYTIENEWLRVTASSVGAELQSLYAKAPAQEVLWQGDPAIWARRAPLLFPIVGRLKDDAYTLAGKRHPLAKHGFAMDAPFEGARAGACEMTFVLEDVDGMREGYPFPFRLRVRYALEKATLHVVHTVENPGREPLFFSIGAHTGFACAMGDTLVFEREEALCPYRLTAEKLLSDAPAGSCGTGRIDITPSLFADDALIFMGLASRAVQLRRQAGYCHVTVAYGGAPCLGIWAKPGAPYVCIEPWYGVDDTASASGRIEEKPHIQRLAPGGCFRFPLAITVEA